jgi:hypothetical protein
MTTSNRKYHSELGFELWNSRGAWFWQLVNSCSGAGTIGSALTKTEAVREAHAAADELSARCASRRVASLAEKGRDRGSQNLLGSHE